MMHRVIRLSSTIPCIAGVGVARLYLTDEAGDTATSGWCLACWSVGCRKGQWRSCHQQHRLVVGYPLDCQANAKAIDHPGRVYILWSRYGCQRLRRCIDRWKGQGLFFLHQKQTSDCKWTHRAKPLSDAPVKPPSLTTTIACSFQPIRQQRQLT